MIQTIKLLQLRRQAKVAALRAAPPSLCLRLHNSVARPRWVPFFYGLMPTQALRFLLSLQAFQVCYAISMATYAIGDIHGRSDLLSELLGEIDPSPADHVVFLGDYIDRGADSRGVIEQLVGFQASSASRVSFLLGNHEQWLLQTLGDFTRHSWLLGMQGLDTVRSYSSEAASRLEAAMKQAGASLLLQKSALPYEAFFNLVPKPHQAFFKNLLPFVRTPDVICVHAGVSRDYTCVEREPISALVWSERDWWQGYTGSDPIVYGHWSNAVGANSSASPHVVGLTFGIDCVASGQLLAIRFPDLKHWVVGNAA